MHSEITAKHINNKQIHFFAYCVEMRIFENEMIQFAAKIPFVWYIYLSKKFSSIC